MHRGQQPRKDYYKLLGVSSNAAVDEIKKAFRKRAMETHPDKADQNKLTKEKAEALFKDIQEAYEVLGDPVNRSLYDDAFGIAHSDSEPTSEFKRHESCFHFKEEEDFFKGSIGVDRLAKYKELEKHLEKYFFSSSLEKLSKNNIEIADYVVEMAIIFRKGNNAFSKSEEKEIVEIFRKLGVNPNRVTFDAPCRYKFLVRGPRICIDLRLPEFLRILGIGNHLTAEYKFNQTNDHDFELKKHSVPDKNAEGFLFSRHMFQDILKTDGEKISKLIKLYELKDASRSELERGLRKAAANKKMDGLKILIEEAKINVNAQDSKFGKTALHWAAEKNATDCVAFLLLNGAKNSIVDFSGKKPSDYSCTPEILLLLNPVSQQPRCLTRIIAQFAMWKKYLQGQPCDFGSITKLNR